jgi:hypothetical protein
VVEDVGGDRVAHARTEPDGAVNQG